MFKIKIPKKIKKINQKSYYTNNTTVKNNKIKVLQINFKNRRENPNQKILDKKLNKNVKISFLSGY